MMGATDMYYECWGEGNLTLIMLHYFGSAGGCWHPLRQELGIGYRYLIPDLPGFGRSAGWKHGYDNQTCARAINTMIRNEISGDYVLVGHSMGGKLALTAASGNSVPGLRGLILLAPSPPCPEPMSKADQKALRSIFGDREKIEKHLRNISAQRLSHSLVHGEAVRHLTSDEGIWDSWIYEGSQEDVSEACGSLDLPVLLLGGSEDPSMTPKVLTENVAALFPRATHKTLVQTGHLVPLEQPQRTAVEIRGWLNSLAGI